MRVLHINTVYKNGGSTGRIVYDLQHISEDVGIDSYVAFGYEYSPSNEQKTYKIESIPELKASILLTRLYPRHGFYNWVTTSRLLRWIERIRPDIIHLHNIHGHYINVQMLFDYIKRKDIPILWTLHDCWSFTGWCANFDYAGCARWKEGCGHCPCKHEYPFTWFFDRSKSNYKRKKKAFTGVINLTIVTPSEWLASLVKQSFLGGYEVLRIPNGIDLEIFHPVDSQFRERNNLCGRHIVLAVAYVFSQRKGMNILIRLAEILPDDYSLVLLGISKSYQKMLPARCVGLPRTESAAALAEAYSAADVFVNPTLEDNYPTTNLEAIACGTPVVTFRTGGSPESIGPGCGIVVEEKTPEALAEGIIRVVEDRNGFTDCRSYAISHFSKADRWGEYIALYREMTADE